MGDTPQAMAKNTKNKNRHSNEQSSKAALQPYDVESCTKGRTETEKEQTRHSSANCVRVLCQILLLTFMQNLALQNLSFLSLVFHKVTSSTNIFDKLL